MTGLWGPAFDAELEYRRSTIVDAARRRGRRAGRSGRSGRGPGSRARADRPARVSQVTFAAPSGADREPAAAGVSGLAVSASPRR